MSRMLMAVLTTVFLVTATGWPAEDVVVADFERDVRENVSRTFVLADRYLVFPVKNGARKSVLILSVDGRMVDEMAIELAPEEPDFWVFRQMSRYRGKKAVLTAVRLTDRALRGFESIRQDNTFPGQESLYQERLRPQVHFTTRRGWTNDPNGLVYYAGQYHLFYQHNPYGRSWGNMTWGHAVSTDLVHWSELGAAIHPDQLGTIFSGSAAVDENNTTGFQTGREKVLVAAYTSAGGTNLASAEQPFTQSIAYSNDRGRTWTKFAGNPVRKHIEGSNRDPKIVWHEPTRQWVIVLYLEDRRLGFFTSRDLKSWRLESTLEGFYECPELFPLAVDGDAGRQKWVVYSGNGDYHIGAFDGRQFRPETGPHRFNHGNCFYASQTFNNVPAEDGRRIQIAWGNADIPGMPFNQMMMFPVELTLRSTAAGVRMYAEPVREIEKLYGQAHRWRNVPLVPGENLLDGVTGQQFDIQLDISLAAASEVGLHIRGVPVVYRVRQEVLQCRDKEVPVKSIDGLLRLRLLVDRTTVEIFAQDGRYYMPLQSIPQDEDKTLALYARGGTAQVNRLTVYELASIW